MADAVAVMRAGTMEQQGLAPNDIAQQDLTAIF